MKDKKERLEEGLSGNGVTDIRAYQGLDDDTFAALDDSSVVDDKLNIMDIRADITQPRRIVPREIRGQWNGMPDGVPALLDKWAHEAGMSADSVVRFLRGSRSIHEIAVGDAVQDEFAKLIDLASQIFDVGLQQRIGVSTINGGYQIIYGERRWMAFHALAHWIEPGYMNIPAKVASVSPWELAKIQAAENFQRVELNAIEKARQFAKLLIVSRQDNTDVPYDAWNALVVDGGCDRPYYAQVADGNIHRIPRGMGNQFEQALGISTGQMRNYRNLLKLTGDFEIDNLLWDLGDALDWAEGFMREISQNLSLEDFREIFDTVTIVTVSQGELLEKRLREASAKSQIKTNPYENLSQFNESVTTVTHLPDDDTKNRYPGNASTPENVTQLPPNPAKSPAIMGEELARLQAKYANKRVILRGGKEAVVFKIETMGLRIRFDDGATALISEAVIEGTKYVPGEADPVTRRVHQTPSPEQEPEPDDFVYGDDTPLDHDDHVAWSGGNGAMDDYTPPAYLDETDTNDGSDNMLSVDGDDDSEVIDSQSMGVISTVRILMTLAGRLGNKDAYDALDSLFCLSSHDIWLLAEMDKDVAESQVIGYAKAIAGLLEGAMVNIEQYTSRILELVADERERE